MTDWESLAKQLIDALESSRIRELAWYLQNRRRLLWSSFASGIFRGLGMAIGFSVLGAIVLLILSRILGVDFTVK